jgi:hypothetical protein
MGEGLRGVLRGKDIGVLFKKDFFFLFFSLSPTRKRRRLCTTRIGKLFFPYQRLRYTLREGREKREKD